MARASSSAGAGRATPSNVELATTSGPTATQRSTDAHDAPSKPKSEVDVKTLGQATIPPAWLVEAKTCPFRVQRGAHDDLQSRWTRERGSGDGNLGPYGWVTPTRRPATGGRARAARNQERRRGPDVIALAHRREAVKRFRLLLTDADEFAGEQERCAGRPEKVWQEFLEANPWILGASLAGQLLTSWSDERLEQVVAGFSVGGVGKRTDALLRTAGLVRSLVFAEIKHHGTQLLATEYRSGCWPPSAELSGGGRVPSAGGFD